MGSNPRLGLYFVTFCQSTEITVFPGPNPWFLWLSPNVFPKTILEYEIAQIFGVKILYYFERFSDILFCIPVNLE